MSFLFFRYGVAFTYYGISLNISGFGLNPYLSQLAFTSTEVPGKIVIYYLLNKVGRRPCQVATLVLTGVCLFINMFVPKGNFQFSLNISLTNYSIYYTMLSRQCIQVEKVSLIKCLLIFLQKCGCFALLLLSLERGFQRHPLLSYSYSQLNSTLQQSGQSTTNPCKHT